ncbi:JAB domain-containing protein [Phascolarctobacterium succinatutens]|uniref:JAB domain-containing protein n=1 Tax=Phascolarctobacterium succinatutens TaxID=626940 RepID=UPI0026EB71D5|nr:JAB domain-containing protein [Phascolarctobacterium succinatutens]
MKIDIVELKLHKLCEVEIPGNDKYIYGIEQAAKIFEELIGGNNIEYVGMLCMDNTNKLVNYSIVSIGNLANVIVPVAQIIKTALLSNASKIIIGHNHPSTVLKITNSDINMTKKIGFIAKNFEIELIDSIIVNANEAISIREYVGEKYDKR